ncbi:MAG: 50S ribosomal protein L29 [Gemmatimonadetes bacterium]|nr:50S ribosomal protein L29 [Gemmatimonadota bacterium]MBI2404000.1 50S ribosomal protein L29 [Gemmatimonadota bacterium]MBI2537595.1 50S ribosomal protein L29 [Gemmatimonadota bacterium]MBI2615701.1 50S ribosomal protein L29 [Gemmatimonadota bacterium]
MRPALARELSVDELKQELAKLEEAQFRLRFRSATEAIENPMQFRMIRRNIARLKTMLKERAAT